MAIRDRLEVSTLFLPRFFWFVRVHRFRFVLFYLLIVFDIQNSMNTEPGIHFILQCIAFKFKWLILTKLYDKIMVLNYSQHICVHRAIL